MRGQWNGRRRGRRHGEPTTKPDRAVGLRHPRDPRSLPPLARGRRGALDPAASRRTDSRSSASSLERAFIMATGGHRARHPAVRSLRRGPGARQGRPQPGQEGRRRGLRLRHVRGALVPDPEPAREPRGHGQPRRGPDAEGRRDPRDGLQPAARLRPRLRATPGGALPRPPGPPPDQRAGYDWDDFWREIEAAGITVWGAAVDTLENTSRFAKGSRHRTDDGAPPLRPAAQGGAALRGLHGHPGAAARRWWTRRPNARS